MSNPEQTIPAAKHAQYPSAPPMEETTEAPPGHTAATGFGFGVSGIVRRWRREDLIRRGSVALRGCALFFSLLSFLIMASNRHGGWKNFDRYQEFRYLLAIAILSTLYNAIQALRHLHHLSSGKQLFPLQHQISALIDFSGDQIAAYLLISAASAAVPMTNRMRDNVDNSFTDSLAASISMAYFAFFTLALSALISGYKLSTNSYV